MVPSGIPLVCARLVQHTKDLMETEEKLCIKVLRTLQQMLVKRNKYGERVSTVICAHVSPTPSLAEPTLGTQGCSVCSSLALALAWGHW